MVLKMTRPVKHPQTGIYMYRRRIPEALQPILGKKEEKRSLGTREPGEAKLLHARVNAEVEEQWRRLSEGVQSLSHREIEAHAGEVYRDLVAKHRDDPDLVPDRVGGLLMDQAFLRPGSVKIIPMGFNQEASRALVERLRVNRNGPQIDEYLKKRGVLVDTPTRLKLGLAVDRAILDGRECLERMAGGDYSPDPKAARFPPLELSKEKRDSAIHSPLAVFDAYAKESKVAPRTVKRWRPIMVRVSEEVSDISEITHDWVIAWKNKWVDLGLSNSSINKVQLACLKTVFRWAIGNKLATHNPTSGVSVKMRGEPVLRDPGYSDEEAQRILTATLEPQPARVSALHCAARRWVPWLCAYTGARVGEIAQLRKQDVKLETKIWMIHITPEAGTVKTRRARWVACHPELVRQGFIDFVSSAADGPLFYREDKKRTATTPQAERVGQHLASWVRETVGIDDPGVQPNHGWRHRFKTLARDRNMRQDAADYIQGHAPSTEGVKYGIHKAGALHREISKLPVVQTKEGSSGGTTRP